MCPWPGLERNIGVPAPLSIAKGKTWMPPTYITQEIWEQRRGEREDGYEPINTMSGASSGHEREES